MNRFTNQILLAVGFAVVAGVISGITAAPAIAQAIKAALVKNVDEKGRVPYSAVLVCEENSGNACSFEVPTAVPGGKRLVIENVNGSVQVFAATVSVQSFSIDVAGSTRPMRFSPRLLGSSGTLFNHVSNEQTLIYFEPGQKPQLSASIFNGSSFIASAKITGYLVDLGI